MNAISPLGASVLSESDIAPSVLPRTEPAVDRADVLAFRQALLRPGPQELAGRAPGPALTSDRTAQPEPQAGPDQSAPAQLPARPGPVSAPMVGQESPSQPEDATAPVASEKAAPSQDPEAPPAARHEVMAGAPAAAWRAARAARARAAEAASASEDEPAIDPQAQASVPPHPPVPVAGLAFQPLDASSRQWPPEVRPAAALRSGPVLQPGLPNGAERDLQALDAPASASASAPALAPTTVPPSMQMAAPAGGQPQFAVRAGEAQGRALPDGGRVTLPPAASRSDTTGPSVPTDAKPLARAPLRPEASGPVAASTVIHPSVARPVDSADGRGPSTALQMPSDAEAVVDSGSVQAGARRRLAAGADEAPAEVRGGESVADARRLESAMPLPVPAAAAPSAVPAPAAVHPRWADELVREVNRTLAHRDLQALDAGRPVTLQLDSAWLPEAQLTLRVEGQVLHLHLAVPTPVAELLQRRSTELLDGLSLPAQSRIERVQLDWSSPAVVATGGNAATSGDAAGGSATAYQGQGQQQSGQREAAFEEARSRTRGPVAAAAAAERFASALSQST